MGISGSGLADGLVADLQRLGLLARSSAQVTCRPTNGGRDGRQATSWEAGPGRAECPAQVAVILGHRRLPVPVVVLRNGVLVREVMGSLKWVVTREGVEHRPPLAQAHEHYPLG
jgi:hypothetical protein